MKVALFPPKCNYPAREPSLEIMGQSFPYIAAALNGAGHEVIARDLNYEWCPESAQASLVQSIVGVTRQHRPDVYGVGGLSGDFAFVRDAIAVIRQVAPDKPIVCGGGILTYDLEYVFPILKPDYGVVGEGEEVVVKLMDHIEHGGKIERIKNVAWWKDGKPRYNEAHFSSKSLDDLPHPNYGPFGYLDLIKRGILCNHILGHSRSAPRILPITMGRSCPYSCTFCCHRAGPKYRQRSVKNAVEEIVKFYEALEFNVLLVYDEVLSVKRARIVEFCEELIRLKQKKRYDFDWCCDLRVTDVDAELLAMLRESGCVLIGYGLESASQTVLDSMKKKVTVAQISAARELTTKAGIAFQGNFIYGDIAETEATMRETWKYFWRHCRSAMIHNIPITPFPGSELFDACVKKGVIRDKEAYYASVGSIGQLRINMTDIPDSIYFSLLDSFLNITNRSNPNLLKLPIGKIESCRVTGIFPADAAAPAGQQRSVVECAAICPHCGKGFTKNLAIQLDALAREPNVRIYCAHCHSRFLIAPAEACGRAAAPAAGDDRRESRPDAAPTQPGAGLARGDYTHECGASGGGRWEHYAAAGIIGRTEYALEGLKAFPAEGDVLFYTGVIRWIAGEERAALECLDRCGDHEHARNLARLIRKPRIEILAQLDRGSWSDLLDAVDAKFSIRNIGFKPGDLPNRPYGSIHDYYDRSSPPDFYLAKMLEWHLVPPDIQELPCPTFAQTADYDIHIQAIHPWLKAFDQLVIEHEWEDVSPLAGVPVATYPKVYPLLKEAAQAAMPAGKRDIDLFISGTTFHPYHPDKARLLNRILAMEGLNVCFVDGFVDTPRYLGLLARTKMCLTYVRRPGMPTRGIEAVAMGCAVLAQDESALRLYLQEAHGVFAYNDANLEAVIREVLGRWDRLGPAIAKGAAAIRREFDARRVASQYFRFLTFLAARPRPKRTPVPKAALGQKRLILLKGWLQRPEVYQQILVTNRKLLDRRSREHAEAAHVIDAAREMVLAYASFAREEFASEFQRIFGVSSPADPALLKDALRRYEEGIREFPASLVLRFNAIRTGLIFGDAGEIDRAVALAEETVRMDPSDWRVDPLDDVFPWDYFSQLFNYRRYFDVATARVRSGSGQNAELVRLILASIHHHLSYFRDAAGHSGRAVELDGEFPFYRMRHAQLLVDAADGASQARAAELFFGLAKDSMLAREAYRCLKEQAAGNPQAMEKCNLLKRKFDLAESRIVKARNSYGDFSSVPFKNGGYPSSAPKAERSSAGKTKPMLNILYIPLEFGCWRDARYWSYTLCWGIEDALRSAGARCFTIPAIHGIAPDHPGSWLRHAEELCAGRTFDQVWFTANHTPLNEAFLRWLKALAPVRVGIFCESLRITDEEWRLNPDVNARRQEIVERCLAVATHALVVDEGDVDLLAGRGVAASWIPSSIPQAAIADPDGVSPAGDQAVFYGAVYGSRKSFLEHPRLRPILIRPERSLEEQTELPSRYDHLQFTTSQSLLTPARRTEPALRKYLEAHRSIRRSAFELWLKTLSAAPVVVNLPQYGFMYAGRVAEAMAVGRPVVAARISERPKTNALFEDGRDILLYDPGSPEQLAEKLERLLGDRTYARQMALNAQQRLRDHCLLEKQIVSVLAEIDGAARSAPRENPDNPPASLPGRAGPSATRIARKNRADAPTPPKGDEGGRKGKWLALLKAAAARQGFTDLKLHLGCGEQRLEGYVNVDYPPAEHRVMKVQADVFADILELDLPDETVDEIRLHHVFEHFNRVTAMALLVKWHRWLKAGGKLHLETPDLAGCAKVVISDAPFDVKMGIVRHLAGDQADAWAYHKDHWFRERFEHTLQKLGFENIGSRASSWPHPPYLANIEIVAQKARCVSPEEQLRAADSLLRESMVSPSETPTLEVWKRQLREFLGGGAAIGRSQPPGEPPDDSSLEKFLPALFELLPKAVAGLPIQEIHDFNQRDRDRWVAGKAAAIPAGSRVLDVGAGTCPYRKLFSHCEYKTHDFKKYEGVKLGDTTEYGQIDYVSDATRLPVPDASFDVVLCTEMLEHVPEPIRVLQEMVRVLKPGGRLLVTAPLGSGLHQLPYHYYGGFTPEWYRWFGERAGLRIAEIAANGGFFKLLAQECARLAGTLGIHKDLHGGHVEFIAKLFGEWLPRYLFAMDEKCRMPEFTVGYQVEAVKKAPMADERDSAATSFKKGAPGREARRADADAAWRPALDKIQEKIDKDCANPSLYRKAALLLREHGQADLARKYEEDAEELTGSGSEKKK